MTNRKGLSLIEILIALIITGIIAACVSAAVIGGYYMLKQAEHKSRAMSIAHVKLQEYMSKSFNQLADGTAEGDEGAISKAFVDTQDNTFFNWTVNVIEGKTGGPVQVPYKNITVETNYTEVNTKGEAVSSKTIRLANMVPYPLIHIQSSRVDYKKTPKAHQANFTSGYPYASTWTDANYNWKDILSDGVLSFNYEVPKDVIVMYNLAVTYDTDKTPDVADTVYTRCMLDNTKKYGIITRTPVMTQVFINNILEMDNVAAGPHTIHIQWSKDNNPTASMNPQVWLRAYDVTIIAVEHTDK